jgi:hypothetical protein
VIDRLDLIDRKAEREIDGASAIACGTSFRVTSI